MVAVSTNRIPLTGAYTREEAAGALCAAWPGAGATTLKAALRDLAGCAEAMAEQLLSRGVVASHSGRGPSLGGDDP